MKNIKPKILLSIAYLLIASFSYGQKDTTYIKPNDSLVCTSKGIAILITKDLVRKDYLEEKVLLLEKDTATLSQIFTKYATALALSNKKEVAYKSVIVDKDLLIHNYNEYILKQDRKLDWSKKKTTISQIALLVLGIFTITKL